MDQLSVWLDKVIDPVIDQQFEKIYVERMTGPQVPGLDYFNELVKPPCGKLLFFLENCFLLARVDPAPAALAVGAEISLGLVLIVGVRSRSKAPGELSLTTVPPALTSAGLNSSDNFFLKKNNILVEFSLQEK